MKTVAFKSGTWHHRLATVYGPYRDWYDTDICQYTKDVIKGMFFALFVIAIGTFAAFPLAWLATYVAAGLTVGLWYNAFSYETSMLLDIGMMMLVVFLFLAVIAGILAGIRFMWLATKKAGSHIPVPSAVAEMYSAWHDKTCFKVTIEK